MMAASAILLQKLGGRDADDDLARMGRNERAEINHDGRSERDEGENDHHEPEQGWHRPPLVGRSGRAAPGPTGGPGRDSRPTGCKGKPIARALTGRRSAVPYRADQPRGGEVSEPLAVHHEPIEARVRHRLGKRALVMIGMMGAGKSSIGRRLAARLRLPFVDADSEIELAANASITEIFDNHGEDFFRDGERRVIRRLLDGEPKVLATGGGAFIQSETRDAIRQSGISIWLQADRDLLLSRVKRRSNRPLLRNGDPGEIIDRLIGEREPVYAEADVHVRSRDVAHDEVVDDILAALDAYLGGWTADEQE
jgi:shikimate kinase